MNYKLPIMALIVGTFAIFIASSELPFAVKAVLCMGFGYSARKFYESWRAKR